MVSLFVTFLSLQTDTLKIVRMLIKHLHYFSNSGGPVDVTPLDRLKRSTLPSLRPQLYCLFKQIFTQWPHDTRSEHFRTTVTTAWFYISLFQFPAGAGDLAVLHPAVALH